MTSGRKPVARVTVRVMRLDARGWRFVAKTRADRAGRYSLTVKPSRSTRYQVLVPETGARHRSRSASRVVTVRPVLAGITPRGTSYGVVGAPKVVTGLVKGRLRSRTVEVQERARGGTWRRVSTGRTDARGVFLAEHTPRASGARELRVVVPAASGLGRTIGKPRVFTVKPSLGSLVSARPRCLGAESMRVKGCRNRHLEGVLLPTKDPVRLAAETGAAYGSACYTSNFTAPLKSCSHGHRHGKVKIALVGDSHAAGLLPGLRDQVGPAGWRLDTYLGRTCRWVDVEPGDQCHPRLVDLEHRLIEGDYDLVVYTGVRDARGRPRSNAERIADQYASAWTRVAATGTRVVGVADFGYLEDDSLACVTGRQGMAQDCNIARKHAYGGVDPIPLAISSMRAAGQDARLVDMTSYYCTATRCPLVVGGVIPYRDKHHLTGTFSRTLGPYLMAELKKLVTS